MTHGFPKAGALSVTALPFAPIEGDVTSYIWTDKQGYIQEMQMPCYGLSQLDTAKKSMERFINSNLSTYLMAHLDHSDFLIANVFKLALQRAQQDNVSSLDSFLLLGDLSHKEIIQNTLLKNCLQLWMASRLIETP